MLLHNHFRHGAIGAQALQAQGFTVGEDLSVTDRSSAGLACGGAGAARQLQARTLATDIRAQAENLVAVDTQVATRITTAIAGLNTAQFTDAVSGGPPGQGPDRPGPSFKPSRGRMKRWPP
jgi:hypothetical protein